MAYKTDVDGSGDVAINPTENAQTLKLFQDGKLDGASLPEPWASRLALTAGAELKADVIDRSLRNTVFTVDRWLGPTRSSSPTG